VFATILIDPRINTDFVTPPSGSFLTCRGEKYVQYYTIIYSKQYLSVGSTMQNSIAWSGRHQCQV
jgi:hypothetical protein